jgi:uncharacterized protein YjbI with pentapeptide repeats
MMADRVPPQEPAGYEPPQSGEELLRRYQQGERYFARAVLAGSKLDGADLRGAYLADADLRGASLMIAGKAGLPIADPNLTGAWLTRALMQGAILAGCILDEADLREAILDGAELDLAKLRGADLSGASLKNLKNAEHARFERVNVENARFSYANLTLAKFSDCAFAGANLHQAQLRGARFQDCQMAGVDLSGVNAAHSQWKDVNLMRAVLVGGQFRQTSWERVDARQADLTEVNLQGANVRLVSWREATLDGADLRGIQVDAGSSVEKAKLVGAAMDRYTFTLLEQSGGLDPQFRNFIPLTDSLAKLRLSFSGWMFWVHFLILAIFLFPYVAFVVKLYSTAPLAQLHNGTELTWQIRSANEEKPHVQGKIAAQSDLRLVPLSAALWIFIKTGGGIPSGAWIAYAAFLYTILYNVVRGALLVKTKRLEHQWQITGIMPQFSFYREMLWKRLYQASVIGFFVNILIIGFHTYHFMQTPVLEPTWLLPPIQ